MVNKRDISIDVIRAVLVLLVVIGHSIQYNMSFNGSDFDDDIVYRFIYSFHMPLFIFLSGYIFEFKKFDLLAKAKLLIIPFFSWGILNSIIQNKNLFDTITNLILNPDSGLWFIYILFYLMLFSVAVFRNMSLISVVVTTIAIMFFGFIATYFIGGVNDFGLGLFCWYLPFFVAGFLAKDNLKSINDTVFGKVVFTLIVLYFLSMIYWERHVAIFNVEWLSPMMNIVAFVVVKYVAAFCVIGLVFFNKDRFTLNSRLFRYLSKQSLAFYAVQFVVIDFLLSISVFNNSIFGHLLLSTMVLIFTSLIVYLLNKVKVVRGILFGR